MGFATWRHVQKLGSVSQAAVYVSFLLCSLQRHALPHMTLPRMTGCLLLF
jgi:hypothetical protein